MHRDDSLRDEALKRQVIGCFFTASVDVIFRNVRVGSYGMDYLIEGRLIVELKAGHQLPAGSRAQLLTYMCNSRNDLGLLLFFGPSPEIERVTV